MKWYLAGAIGFTRDLQHKTWRDELTKFLESLGHQVLNPLNKPLPTSIGDVREYLNVLRDTGRIEESRGFTRRYVIPQDLAMVDESDVILAYIQKDIHICGTYGEITHGFVRGKIIFVVTNLENSKLPNWLIGCSTFIFRSFEEFKAFFGKENVSLDRLRSNKKIWVAFSGKAGCGKSTIAKNLVRNYGFVRMSFAKKLKKHCKELFPEIMKRPKEEYRKILQLYGCFCRLLQGDCWIQIVVNQIHDLDRVVIDDVRFLNEFIVLQKLGFNLIRVERDSRLLESWGYNVKDTHESETQLDFIKDWNLIVKNNGKYPFKDATKEILERLGIREDSK